MEQYNAVLAENPKVAFIHVSHDRDEDAAEEWAAQHSFPWLTVLPGDVDRSDLVEYKTRNSVPHYVLLDSEGNMLANSSSDAFGKIKELSGE